MYVSENMWYWKG